MNQTKTYVQNSILFITDFICLMMSYYLAGYVWLMAYKQLDTNLSTSSMNDNLITVIATFAVARLIYSKNENYTSRGIFQEAVYSFKTNVIMAALIAIYQLLGKNATVFPRGVYVFTIAVNVVLLLIVRQFVKVFLVRFKHTSDEVAKMFVITTSGRIKPFLEDYNRRDNWLRRITGMAVLDQNMKGQNIHGIPVVADAQDMMKFIKNETVDEVFISLGEEDGRKLAPLVMELEDMGIVVHLKLEVMDSFKDFDVSLGKVGNVPVVTFANRFYDLKHLTVKRIMDIIGAIFGIAIMLVTMVFVVPAIKLESRGPLFFKQKRVGKNGRYFYIYKFRSMYIDAEERKKELMAQNEMNGLMFKMKDDPRITKVGKFLRKTSIDELPQFINVLQGDMSLVGTRPPTVNEFKQYEGHHKRRLSMKPGITGMWQAYGRNTVTDFEEIVEMDLDYIDNWSLVLDIKILFKTVFSVLGGSGQ